MARPVLERSIENNVVQYARRLLGKDAVVKLNGVGKRSLPDRMFLGPGGRVLYIEFKRPGEKPTPLQAALHREWAKLGHKVHVVEDVATGRKLVNRLAKRSDLMLYPVEGDR